MPRYIVKFQEGSRVYNNLCDHGTLFLREILQSIYLGKVDGKKSQSKFQFHEPVDPIQPKASGALCKA